MKATSFRIHHFPRCAQFPQILLPRGVVEHNICTDETRYYKYVGTLGIGFYTSG